MQARFDWTGPMADEATARAAADAALQASKADKYGKSVALTSVAGVVTIDVSATEDHYTLALTENVTSWVFTNLPAAGYYRDLFVRVTQHASAAKTVASPASAGSTAGGTWTMSTTVSAKETLGLRVWSDGAVTLYPGGVQG